jgi:hypothetical protein
MAAWSPDGAGLRSSPGVTLSRFRIGTADHLLEYVRAKDAEVFGATLNTYEMI